MIIPYNTVFNPTVNGHLHLGHVYMALVNAAEAHANRGCFYLLFDDTQTYWNDRVGWKQVEAYKDQMIKDLEWLGVMVDEWYSASALAYEARKRMTQRCHECGLPVPVDHHADQHFPDVRGDTAQTYPYTAFKTMEKVIFHEMLGVTLRIAGYDLLNEFSLYCYFCETMRLHMPRHVYLNRLRVNGCEISKTNGDLSIKNFREHGCTPAQVMHDLEQACLRVPGGGWQTDNLLELPDMEEDKSCDHA